MAASNYLLSNGFGLKPRFDVAEVMVSNDNVVGINYIENAFGIDDFKDFKSTL